ncbi:MAG: M28 family peptidase, partial [Gemmatimonadota bacterium]|nr:M28 family peptidase [Gemmatimonadota bacterium]
GRVARDAGRSGIDTLRLEGHARFLASDLLEGRAPGTRGERLAAAYLATGLFGLGLEPLPGRDDYRLPVPLTAIDVDEVAAQVRIMSPTGTKTLRSPAFYHPGGSRDAFRNFEGELLFAGAEAEAVAVLDGEEVEGSIVVLTPPWEDAGELEQALVAAGAAGALYLVPSEAFYERLRIVRGPMRYALPDVVDDPANQTSLPSLVGGPGLIRALGLEIPSGSVGEWRAPGALDRSMDVRLPHETERRTGYNVAAGIVGADPDLRHEWIVYVAHYDHVGYAEPTAGDSLWNGFVDNAIGSAILLEIARILAADPPARSVAFLWTTAEEQGLLGANWFVYESTIPPERIRAAINIDGGAPPAPPIEWGLVGADASDAGRAARQIVEGHGWTVNGVGMGPQSDHWPFHRAGIPALLLFPGSELEGHSEKEARALAERWIRAHTPEDEWHPDFPLAGVARYAKLALEIGRSLAGVQHTYGEKRSP